MYKEELAAILPHCRICTGGDCLEQANTATFPTYTKNYLVIQPLSVDDIISIVRFSNNRKLRLHTISQGKNWGFGSRVPPQDVHILMDLSQLNKISDYDPQFGTVTCEPGVSFAQLSRFLQEQGNHHFLNVIGGDPGASVLGNILERGDGTGPYCERSAFACSPEIVLADGSIQQSGFANIKNSRLGAINKNGIGPGLQELFFQSNYGIVTRITIWLQPVPAFFRSFSFSQHDTQPLSLLLNRIRSLYSKNILISPVTFWNDYKQMAGVMQFPPQANRLQTPLSRELIKKNSNNYSSWYAFGGIYVDDEKISRQILSKLFAAVKPYTKKTNAWSQLSTRRIGLLRSLNGLLGLKRFNFNRLLQEWDHNPLLGRVSDRSIQSVYWRKKQTILPPADPHTHQCGVCWNAFSVPFDGALIEKLFSGIEEIVFRHGFEPIISFVTLNPRYIKVFQQLVFDREDDAEEKAAVQCHNEVFDYIEKEGCSHTRIDILHMNGNASLFKSDTIQRRIKQALDPNGILSPGKYFITSDS